MTANIQIQVEDPRRDDARCLISALDELMTALYPAESNHLLSVHALAAANVLFLGARQAGTLVGCGAVRRYADYGEIKRLYVLPQARGHGIAQQLVAALEAHLVSSGLLMARLETGIKNPDALALYGRMGYRRCGPFGDYTDDPLAVFMQKALN